MWRAAVLAVVVACGYGDGEGLYFESLTYESRTYCEPARCALAARTPVDIGIAHWASDTVQSASIETFEVDRPDLLEVAPTAVGLRLRGLAAGIANVRVAQQGYTGPIEVTQAIEIVEPAGVFIVSPGVTSPQPQPDGRMRLLANSKHKLLLERVDAHGEPLLGDYELAWTSSSPAIPLGPTGTTGVLVYVEAAGPETFTVTTTEAQLPIDIVPVSEVASLRVFVRDRPHLAATDGGTIRMPENASFAFEVDAFDAAGRFIAGRGGPGDFVVEGTRIYWASTDRGFSPASEDATITIRVGAASMRVKLDYP